MAFLIYREYLKGTLKAVNPSPTNLEIMASCCFGGAVAHTFATKFFAKKAQTFPPGSVAENFFHFLAEVEVVFGFWAFLFLGVMSAIFGTDEAVHYLDHVNFTEAAFVFVVMAMAATRPVTDLASMAIRSISGVAPLKMRTLSYYFLCLTLGPLLGSFITEPAAMAVTALLLSPVAFATPATHRLRYMTLALLFVNVSIGGTLTHFAAPPVVMVADTWRWDFGFMMANFGWKSALAVLINGILGSVIALNELSGVDVPQAPKDQKPVPLWITAVSLVFLGLVVRYHAHIAFFVPLFLMFVGWHQVTSLHQEPLKLREALLVGFFLGGLVTLGDFQRWWLEPLITSLSSGGLFLGATGLTAITDNAALTYLGSLVSGLSDASKYALVAGAVSGGGLTVIANAPNPVGIGLLKDFFSDRTVSARLLFLYALVPTSVAMICLWIL